MSSFLKGNLFVCLFKISLSLYLVMQLLVLINVR